MADTDEALVTACAPGAQARRPVLYEAARVSGDRNARGADRDGGRDEAAARRFRTWYVNFELPMRRTPDGFDTFDLPSTCSSRPT
ncbi:hypothetical protein [Streptomyces sp. NPDC058486]|uniref:hypothetical protein n=1 Tax=unclassified Streptomyces TaxID=2593676 RepID=UPI0036555267